MAGCFGNSFWDRNMESQLMRHLAQEDAWNDFYEAVTDKMSDKFWEQNEDWCLEYDGQLNKWMNKLYNKRWIQPIGENLFFDLNHIAKLIERAHKMFIK